MRIAINGFGRIGRVFFKIALERGLNIVAINDVHGARDAEYLLKYDSIYGKFEKRVDVKGNDLVVAGKKVRILSERDPLNLPWKEKGIDVVVESTGVFREPKEAGKHVTAGAKYVLVTAPSKGQPDLTVVPGVNHEKLKREHKILSVASCTTNCLVPMVKVLHDSFRIKKALFTTVHAYTNDQALHDSAHQKLRRGRAAALNIVPTTTGASESVIEIFPKLLGRINGLAIRVPVAVGSLTDLVVEVEKKVDVRAVNHAFKKSSQTGLKGILEYSEEELVSGDVIGNAHSCVFDSLLTQTEGNLVKVLGWYDNEFGYSNRVVDVIKMLKKWC
jgi:glyceraldehyde-3-phosphate dehydrogenase type I